LGDIIKKLNIIIVTYNSLAYISECIDSIYNNPPDNGFKPIVVDNASTDGTNRHIRKNYPDIKLITNDKNRGFAAAVNQGIDSSASDYILLINADCEVYVLCSSIVSSLVPRERKRFLLFSISLSILDISLSHFSYSSLSWSSTSRILNFP